MSGHFIVTPLASERITQAYALVSIFDAGLSQETWNRYAADIVGAANGVRGIMSVQNQRGHIYGLSVYDLKVELRRGRILEVENFVVADLLGAAPAAGLLLESLEGIARKNQCHCMSLGLLNPKLRRALRRSTGAKRDVFEAAGFSGEPLRLRKCFENG